MIQSSQPPSLLINRLAVYRKGKAVYDELFHSGVNIIRGSNSSGKSTIADFLFFVLGGDFNKWKPEAEECDFVFAELQVTGAVLTLRREITRSTRQNMGIFWGAVDSALGSSAEGWQFFPFQRSESKMSFSQVLFNALGFPEVRGDADSNITMHQLLRLLYVDQLSSVQSLLRDEDFDSPLTRRTIGDLLFGIYDDTLYSAEMALREAKKRLEGTDSQLKNLLVVFDETEQEIEIDKITNLIDEKEGQLQKISSALKDYDSTKEIKDASISEEMEILRARYIGLQDRLANLKNSAHRLMLDIEDSHRFIWNMEERIKAFDQASVARDSLSTMRLNQCPVCLSVLGDNFPEGVCHLCKNPISPESQKSQMLRMKQELLFQIRESKQLLIAKEDEHASILRQLPELEEEVVIAKLELEEELGRVRTTRDRHLDELLTQKGRLESEILSLHRQAKALSVLETLKKRQRDLKSTIQSLALSIHSRREKQKKHLGLAHDKIEMFAAEFLRTDLPREDFFMTPERIKVDFEKNTFSVNDRNQFSASSIVYLKNCIHYAIFFASLELAFFRYPRFILCDNMEDKGMEEKRSQHFQRKIVETARNYSGPFQIIFTTSMIDPSLDDTPLCVGQKYSKENKSLKFV
jgi:hypothetical protein